MCLGVCLAKTVVLLRCRKAREGALIGRLGKCSGLDCMAMNLEGGLFR